MRKIIFLLTLFFLSCSPHHEALQLKVIEVIDGDTIKLSNGKLLRYIGIDTPETMVREGGRFVHRPKPFSQEAKEYNRKLVEGKDVRIEFDVERKDKYGRLLGYCFVNEVFVNEKLVEEGLAVLYTYPPNIRYVKVFVEAQKNARGDRKGLWGAYEVISPAQANKFMGHIRTVRGKVLSTYNSGKVIFLNFGTNYKTDFTAVIFKNSFKYFHDKGISPESFYKGKVIEISGRIREYNGPEIIVNTPYEIEVIE